MPSLTTLTITRPLIKSILNSLVLTLHFLLLDLIPTSLHLTQEGLKMPVCNSPTVLLMTPGTVPIASPLSTKLVLVALFVSCCVSSSFPLISFLSCYGACG
eukprot:GILI01013471.1.p2 GENE.GILI01013471.1~~GILI01013471.1.p2  ORF type:complete len:101 (-),score=15.33 GILI01013471.1:424-726(-)